MDLREKKTKRSIKKAFLEIREKKPLEKITVKELSELAEISKATFYLHYKDIYDLSEELSYEVINEIVNGIEEPENILDSNERFITELSKAMQSQEKIISILFSGSQSSIFPDIVGDILKERIYRSMPELRNDKRFQVVFTFRIYGSIFAANKHSKEYGHNFVIDVLKDITESII